MVDALHEPAQRVRELPPYQAVVVVDLERFSDNQAADQPNLIEEVSTVLRNAFRHAGYGRLWEERRFPEGAGDGYAVGFRPEVLPILVGPFLDSLQVTLREHDKVLRQRDRNMRMRMRVGISVGPLTLSEDDRISSGSGDARVEVSRLLEADELKQLLARSNKDVTFVAAILSNRVYEDVVAAGFATKPTSVFVPTTVQVKQYQGKAYLHVPVPSGDLLTQGFVAPAAPDQTELDTPPETEMRDVIRGSKPFMGNVNNSISGEVRGPAIQAGYIDNYTHNDSHNHYRGGQHVTGNNNTVAGRDVSINEGRKKKRGNR